MLCKGVLSWDGAQPFAGSGWLLKDDQPAAAVSCYDTEETFVCHFYVYIYICLVVAVFFFFLPVTIPNVLQSEAIAGLHDSPLLLKLSEGKMLLEHLVRH